MWQGIPIFDRTSGPFSASKGQVLHGMGVPSSGAPSAPHNTQHQGLPREHRHEQTSHSCAGCAGKEHLAPQQVI